MSNDKEYFDKLTSYNMSNAVDVERLNGDLQNSVGPLVIKMTDENSNDYTVGVALPKGHPAALNFLKELDDYNNVGKDIYDQIDLCRKLYLFEGVVGTVIDMYIDFSISPFKVEDVSNKKAKDIIDYFLRNVNKNNNNISKGFDSFNRDIALNYYINGNCFPYSKWSNVIIDNKSKVRLPMNIVNLDPKIIEIPKESVQFGGKVIKISYNKVFNDYSNQIRTSSLKKDILNNVPTKVRNKFKNEKDLELDPYLVYHIKRKGTMYSGWGVPYLTRCFSAIASKRRLRVLDDSTIDGLVNSITVFKIGDPKNDATLKPSRLRAFSALLNKPHASMTLVWSYDVDVLNVAPNGEILKFSDRYKDINEDIIQALGIPLAVLTGQGDKAGDVWASILFLMERFEEYRSLVASYLEDILEKIMIENGFEDIKPRIRYIKPKVDKSYIRDIILALYDRGLLSKETTLEEAGYKKEEQFNIRKEENKDMEVMARPDVPYAPNINEKQEPKQEKTNTGTPNPQMKQNTDRNKKEKITEMNKNKKKVTPRLEGSTIQEILSFAIDNSKNIDQFKETISNLSDTIYHKSLGTNLLDIDQNTFDKVIAEILDIKTKSKSKFRSLMIDVINNKL